MESPNYEETGDKLLKGGNFEEAIKVYEAAIKLAPNNPEYHFKIGMALESIGNFQEALKEFKIAISMDSNISRYHDALGRLLFDLKEFGDSQVEIDRAIALEPKKADYHLEKAKLLTKNEKYQEAMAEIETAEKLEPNSVSLHLSKSSIFFALRRYENAVQELDVAISFEPSNPQAHADKGQSLERLGRYEDAVREYDTAIKLSPNNPELYVSKATVLRGMKKYDEADAEVEKAINLKPNDPRYRRFKFDILEDKRKFEELERVKEKGGTGVNYEKTNQLSPRDKGYQSLPHNTALIPSFKDLSNFEYLITKSVPERILLNGEHYVGVAFYITNLRVGVMNLDGSNGYWIWYHMLKNAEVGKFKLPKVPTGATPISGYVGAKIGQLVARSIMLGVSRDAIFLRDSNGNWLSIKDKSANDLVDVIRKTYTIGKEVSSMLIQAQEREANDDIAGVLSLFRKAVELDPRIPNAEYVEGSLEFAVGEYGRALSKFRAAVNKTPTDSSVIYLLAECYYALHEFDQASATIEEYLSKGLTPTDGILSRRPLYDLFAGKISQALEEARERVKMEPADSETVAIYAACCAAAGYTEDALTNLKQAIKFSPSKRTKFSINVARGFIMANDHDSAERIVKESLSFDPYNQELIDLNNQFEGNKPNKINGTKTLANSYNILGLQPGVSKEIIEAVYQTLVKQYHPDSNIGATPALKKIAEEKMKEITEAYKEIMSHSS